MPINYEQLLVESPERREDYDAPEDGEEMPEIEPETELNFD